jgi:hypothetical protein
LRVRRVPKTETLRVINDNRSKMAYSLGTVIT